MNICIFTTLSIRNQLNYSYKYNNIRKSNKSDYTISYVCFSNKSKAKISLRFFRRNIFSRAISFIILTS